MFKLKIVTPERVYLDQEVESLKIRAFNGELGLLSNHAPMVATTKICTLTVVDANKIRSVYSINAGVLSYKENACLILTDSIESPEEIDINRANKSLERAITRLDNIEFDKKRVILSQKRAKNRIRVAKYGKHI